MNQGKTLLTCTDNDKNSSTMGQKLRWKAKHMSRIIG